MLTKYGWNYVRAAAAGTMLGIALGVLLCLAT